MNFFDHAHPGELIRETIDGIRDETVETLTIAEIAKGLGTTRKALSAIINGRRRVTPEMAIRFSVGFPNTDAAFWLKVQGNYDLSKARRRVNTDSIRVCWTPSNASSADKT